MPDLTIDQLTLALGIVGAVALIGFLISIVLAFRIRKVRKEYAVLRGDGADRDIFDAVGRGLKQVRAIDERVDGFVADLQEQAAIGKLAIQKFHMVRYDAFEDMGGRLSFSAALLNDHGDGFVLTSINGRTETRTYAKPIKELHSEYNLSDEERAAIAGAASGDPRVSVKR